MWPKFKKERKKLFTIEELCKLRRAETEREMSWSLCMELNSGESRRSIN
jgi:hypothetical protein